MLSKKEIGMVALAGVGLVGVSYFAGDAIGGGGARAGQILGSPGGLTPEAFASTGVSAAKLAPSVMQPSITPQVAEQQPKKEITIPGTMGIRAVGGLTVKGEATKAKVAARQAKGFVSFTPAPTQTYTPKAISESQTFGKVAVAAAGGGYVPKSIVRDPTTSKIGRFQAAVMGGSSPSRTQTGLTAKGLATQKKAVARKKTPTSGYAAALARSG